MFQAKDIHENTIDIDDSLDGEIYHCPLCRALMVRRINTTVRRPHFAHKSGSNCDSWYKSTSLWQEKWISLFNKEEREVPIIEDEKNKHFLPVLIDDKEKKRKTALLFFDNLPSTKRLFEQWDFFLKHTDRIIIIINGYTKAIKLEHPYLNSIFLNYASSIEGKYKNRYSFSWAHAGSKYSNILYDVECNEKYKDKIKFVLQVNDHLLLGFANSGSTSQQDWTFQGVLMNFPDFITYVAGKREIDKEAIESTFKDYYLEEERAFNIQDMENYLMGRDGFVSEENKVILKAYKENRYSVQETIEKLKISHVPSEDFLYFKSKYNPYYLDNYLATFEKKEEKQTYQSKSKVVSNQPSKPIQQRSSAFTTNVPVYQKPPSIEIPNRNPSSYYQSVYPRSPTIQSNSNTSKPVMKKETTQPSFAQRLLDREKREQKEKGNGDLVLYVLFGEDNTIDSTKVRRENLTIVMNYSNEYKGDDYLKKTYNEFSNSYSTTKEFEEVDALIKEKEAFLSLDWKANRIDSDLVSLDLLYKGDVYHILVKENGNNTFLYIPCYPNSYKPNEKLIYRKLTLLKKLLFDQIYKASQSNKLVRIRNQLD